MMTVVQARTAMLSAVRSLGTEDVPLEAAVGRVLAKPVRAGRDQPPFAVSAMDGYALRSADTPGTLRVVGESAAGRGFEGAWGAGDAVRISTGAAIPDGADTVVIQEDVQRDGDVVAMPAAKAGKNVRPQAGDFSAGAILLQAGRRLDGVAVSLAAAAGLAHLSVQRRPRVAILCSGDELAEPGSEPGRYQVFDSATFGIAALVQGWGAAAHRMAGQKDDTAAIARAAQEGLRDSDLLLLIGGASVGDHDHARPALVRLGLELAVEKIAVRPGKPTWFGVAPGGFVMGLPGNPASALACAHLFLRPLLDAMMARDPLACVRTMRARLLHSLPANGPREHYLRSFLDADDQGQLTVRAFEDQDSSLISVFAGANALLCLPPGAATIEAGGIVDVLPLGEWK